ncbi:MAG: hypothetical protein O3B24_03470, partial [Verrucomicrobia bacterium]|nr:hypothetical protein [Verrucomicrobiota bacterium]
MNASSAQPPCDAQQPCDQASASAPGSLMLFGEHAVLHGHLAIACSIDPRVTVRVHRRADGDVHVSSALGECQSAMRAPDTSAPFQFLMTAVTDFAKQLPGGVTVHVQSEFRADMGLGSSAAVTVATYAALDCLCGTRRVQDDLLMRCRAIVRRVQGRGSGTDVAAGI